MYVGMKPFITKIEHKKNGVEYGIKEGFKTCFKILNAFRLLFYQKMGSLPIDRQTDTGDSANAERQDET